MSQKKELILGLIRVKKLQDLGALLILILILTKVLASHIKYDIEW